MSQTKTKRRPKYRKDRPDPGMGVIRSGEAYPVRVFIRIVGTTEDGFRQMQRRGLKTKVDGKRTMIKGDDYLDYLDTLPSKRGDGGSQEHKGTSEDGESEHPDGSP